MSDKARLHQHRRDLQIMPADGWWAVYGFDDGTLSRQRIVGFALVEEWSNYRFIQTEPEEDDDVARLVLPLTVQDNYVDHEETDNLLGIVHADEWPEAQANFIKLAQDEAARKKKTVQSAPAVPSAPNDESEPQHPRAS